MPERRKAERRIKAGETAEDKHLSAARLPATPFHLLALGSDSLSLSIPSCITWPRKITDKLRIDLPQANQNSNLVCYAAAALESDLPGADAKMPLHRQVFTSQRGKDSILSFAVLGEHSWALFSRQILWELMSFPASQTGMCCGNLECHFKKFTGSLFI